MYCYRQVTFECLKLIAVHFCTLKCWNVTINDWIMNHCSRRSMSFRGNFVEKHPSIHQRDSRPWRHGKVVMLFYPSLCTEMHLVHCPVGLFKSVHRDNLCMKLPFCIYFVCRRRTVTFIKTTLGFLMSWTNYSQCRQRHCQYEVSTWLVFFSFNPQDAWRDVQLHVAQ